jgi:hypothetical protein
MKYGIDVGSGATTHTPSLTKTGSGVNRGYTDIETAWRTRNPTQESRLKW